MMRKFIFAALLLASPAFAQAPQRYTINVSPDQLQVILNALTNVSDTPWKTMNPVIATVVEQMKAQQAQTPTPTAPAAPPPQE